MGSALSDTLDGFLPEYDVCERHGIAVRAPAEVVYAAACELDMDRIWIVRAIIRIREWLLGAQQPARELPPAFLKKRKGHAPRRQY